MLLRIRLLVVVAMVALAGCSDAPSSSEETSTSTTSTADASGNGTVMRELQDREVTLYLHENLTLSETQPEAGAVTVNPLGSPGLALRSWVSGPLGPAWVPDEVVVTIWYEYAPAQVSNQAFDFAAWFGGEHAIPFSLIKASGTPATPGGPLEVEMRLPNPGLPWVLPTVDGANLTLAAWGSYGTGEGRVLVGGDHASQVTFRLVDLAQDPFNTTHEVSIEETDGIITGIQDPNCGAVEQTVRHHLFQVAENATYLWVHMVSVTPTADLDLQLSKGDSRVGQATSPRMLDGMLLAGEEFAALRGQELDLRIGNCGAGTVDYTFAVEQD